MHRKPLKERYNNEMKKSRKTDKSVENENIEIIEA